MLNRGRWLGSLGLIPLLFLGVGAAWGASFDCAKAQSYAEKQICALPELSYADDQLSSAYEAAKRWTGNSDAFHTFVKQNWQKREACKDIPCLKVWYVDSFYQYNRIANDKSMGMKPFVTGISSGIMFRLKDDPYNNGLKFLYKHQDRALEFGLFFDQMDIAAYCRDEKEQYIRLGFIFGDITHDETGFPHTLSEYAIGQHDFDGDGADEVVFAVRTTDEKNGNAFAVYVYRIRDGKHWLVCNENVLGNPRIEVKANKIRVNRNLHGLYYEWTFKDGNFKDTGSY